MNKSSNLMSIVINLLALLQIWRCNYSTSMYFVDGVFNSNVFLIMFLMWFYLACLKRTSFLNEIVSFSWPFLLFLIFNIFLDILINGGISQNLINYIIVFILFSITLFYLKENNIKFKITVVMLILIDILVKQIYSWQQLLINPNIIRQMSTAYANYLKIGQLIGDYSFVYSCVIITCAILFCAIQCRSVILKICLWVFAVFSILFIVKASFFFSIMLLFLGIAMSLFVKRKGTFIMLPIFILISILLLRIPLSNFCFDLSKSTIWSNTIQGKFYDMGNFLLYGQDGAWMTSMRIDAIERSWDTFLTYPLMGTFGLRRSALSGGHSGWLDGIAEFGLLRYSLFVIFMNKAFNLLLSSSNNKKLWYVSIFILICLGTINPVVFPQIWAVMFVIMSFLDNTIIPKEKQHL